jgi:hypothetical protein
MAKNEAINLSSLPIRITHIMWKDAVKVSYQYTPQSTQSPFIHFCSTYPGTYPMSIHIFNPYIQLKPAPNSCPPQKYQHSQDTIILLILSASQPLYLPPPTSCRNQCCSNRQADRCSFPSCRRHRHLSHRTVRLCLAGPRTCRESRCRRLVVVHLDSEMEMRCCCHAMGPPPFALVLM